MPGAFEHSSGNGGLLLECFVSPLSAAGLFIHGFYVGIRPARGDMDFGIVREELFPGLVAKDAPLRGMVEVIYGIIKDKGLFLKRSVVIESNHFQVQPVDEGAPVDTFVVEGAIPDILFRFSHGIPAPAERSPLHDKGEQDKPIQKRDGWIASLLHDTGSAQQ